MNNDFIAQARKFAAKGMNKCNGTAISADDVFVVWFCKTLQKGIPIPKVIQRGIEMLTNQESKKEAG